MIIASDPTSNENNLCIRMLRFKNRETWREQAKQMHYRIEAYDDVNEGWLIAYNNHGDPVGAMPWSQLTTDRTTVDRGWMVVML